MAATASPMGAEPVGTLSASGSFSGKVRHIKIASGYATNIFYGDFVKMVSAGVVEKDTGTSTLTPVGVFMGCAFTDPNTKQKTFSQIWPASTVAADAVAYVMDDPDAVFRMQSDEALVQSDLGNNVGVVQTAGSTDIGRSKNALDGSTAATTNTLPLRIVEFVDGPDSAVGDAFTDALVFINFGDHQYRQHTGTGT
ncbi:MAG TPA: hypothetical protein DCW74_19100 [Alteromonas australica]|uniref:Uncharacterized protein n=1 Tax=Alteromonas australica TaxID=589873 RepID=A0A350P962_9ALTE|nr:hypothetical protein [Alteromonas australica]|tara:strand:+ start:810 stop:1397 length:588 start_codon:yes stop_codon:yes gene_type:complete